MHRPTNDPDNKVQTKTSSTWPTLMINLENTYVYICNNNAYMSIYTDQRSS